VGEGEEGMISNGLYCSRDEFTQDEIIRDEE
jgi:hypothetical protein